jgi:hypothetical protein
MSRSRTGKIARLPKSLRDVLNLMLQDGATYNQIRAAIAKAIERTPLPEGEKAPDLNDQNIQAWREGGYQDWLGENERLNDMRMKRELALTICQQNEGSKIHEAAVQIASSQIYEVLTDLDPATLTEKLHDNPEQYARLINALAKLSDSGLKYERYRAEVADKKAKIEGALSRGKSGVLSSEDIAFIESQLKLL